MAWLLVAWTVAITAIGGWLGFTDTTAIREQLRHAQFWVLEAQFFILAALSIMCLPVLVRSLAPDWRQLRLPIVASILALVLATAVAPRTSRIYYDEQIYQGIAQNLADLRLAQMCNDGNVEYGMLQCRAGEYNKEPYGYPYLLSIVYRVFGTRWASAYAVNALLPPLLVWVVFLLSASLVLAPAANGAPAAGIAALIAALVPEYLRWSHTAAAEPATALISAFAVLAATAFVRAPAGRTLIWMVVATAFAVQFRPESILLITIVFMVIALYAPGELLRVRTWWGALAGLILVTPHLGHLFAMRHEPWGASGSRMSADFFVSNLQSNGWFYLGDARFPVLYTALALVAITARRETRATTVAVMYFLLFWGVFLFFYAGSYNYGADDRFSLMVVVPVAILGGLGAWRICDLLGRFGWAPERVGTAVAAALLAQFLWYLPFVRATGEEAWGARADVEFARSVAETLPANSVVLTHNPNMFHVWGRSAAQMSLVTTDASFVQNALAPRYAGGVFLHWNFWCNVDDVLQQAFCSEALARFPHQIVREHRERNHRYAFYKLELGGAPDTSRARIRP